MGHGPARGTGHRRRPERYVSPFMSTSLNRVSLCVYHRGRTGGHVRLLKARTQSHCYHKDEDVGLLPSKVR